MSIEIKVPVLPESVADATVATWHKKPGDTVRQDENIVDIETDKVMLEVPAGADGVLKDIKAQAGTVVSAQQVIGLIEQGAVAPEERADEPTESRASEPAASASKHAQTSSVKAGPAARRAAQAAGVDVAQLAPGSGPTGQIKKSDVQASRSGVAQQHRGGASVEAGRTEQRVPMTRLRAKIAERLLSAQQNAAILTTFNEVNMQPVMAIRQRYKKDFIDRHDVKLGFMSFFVKASVEALRRFPGVNASIDGNDLVYHGYFDVGVAVSTDRGLVVPIIRDADQLSMADLEKAIVDFGQRGMQGKLGIEEMTGGTFTVSNGGVFGSLLSTPILNPPQSAILGMHKIEERAVVENGQVVVRPMMYLALSYDHRIIDGKESVTFLRTIKELLEDPTRLLLDL